MDLFDVYSIQNIEPIKALGCTVYDSKGQAYLDLYGGHAVISIGHTHPSYVKAVEEQIRKLGFYSNSVVSSIQRRYAELLGQISGYNDYSLFLCNSGAEANENAIKIASFHTGKSKVLAFKGSFHGRTSGAVAVTDIPAYSAEFNRTGKVCFVPLNDIEAVNKELETGEYCAVILEGIQGVGGIRIPNDDFLKALRTSCTKYACLLILDEIQSGCGRSGKYFAHQYADIRPDLISLAKGIGNGFPMAALMLSPIFKPVKGSLGTTFGGNHLACAAGIAVAEVMTQENLVENSFKVGNYLIDELKKIPQIKEVRGRGLIIGIEMENDISDLRNELLFKHRIFTGSTGTKVIRLLPPLCLTKEEASHFLDVFSKMLKA